MNVLRAEKHYFNNNYKLFIVNLSNLVFSVSPCPPPFVELPNRVQFLCLSGDDLTLSVCYKKGNFTTMALFWCTKPWKHCKFFWDPSTWFLMLHSCAYILFLTQCTSVYVHYYLVGTKIMEKSGQPDVTVMNLGKNGFLVKCNMLQLSFAHNNRELWQLPCQCQWEHHLKI